MAVHTVQGNTGIYRVGLLNLVNIGITKAEKTYENIIGPTIRSKQAYEEFIQTSGLGLLQNVDELERIPYDLDVQRATKRITPIMHTLAVKMSKQSKNKDINGFIKRKGPQLAESAIETKNYWAALLLILGATTVLAPDGLSLFNTAHLGADGSSQSNLGTSPFSALALQDTLALFRDQKSDRGIPRRNKKGVRVICSVALEPYVWNVLDAEGLAGTTDNDSNSFIKRKVTDCYAEDYLTAFGNSGFSDAWGLFPVDKTQNPLFLMQTQEIDTDVDYDMDIKANKMAIDEEYVFDCFDWRNTYWQNP